MCVPVVSTVRSVISVRD